MFIENQLVRADMNELNVQMESDEQLKAVLTAKGEDIPKKYFYLIGEIFPNWDKYSLYDVMNLTADKLDPSHIYFSKAGNKIVGWAAYQTNFDVKTHSEYVSEIKMFSFNLSRPNPVLLRDLKLLMDKLVEKYSVVSWMAVAENPANTIYQKVIHSYENCVGNVETLDNGNLLYSICHKN